ncbi:MAG: hypothetical protein NC548_13080 [Lachnospiraceae bacterium]|nr:hypothetical protein [Lachnospiraceae bacterium]MCM1230677.1 hypothetical protein [Ruminococcus flavefaciens]
MTSWDWYIRDVKREDRREFIIKGLQKYIDEATELIGPEPSGDTNLEIAEIVEFYKAIIEELGGEVK